MAKHLQPFQNGRNSPFAFIVIDLHLSCGTFSGRSLGTVASAKQAGTAQGKDWRARWEANILGDARNRYCDKEMGEEPGWLVSPFLNGFFYGYQATGNPKWVELLIDWTNACIRRGVQEPDGFRGWPKRAEGGGGASEYFSDSLLGEAMLLRPVVLLAGEILKSPALNETYGREPGIDAMGRNGSGRNEKRWDVRRRSWTIEVITGAVGRTAFPFQNRYNPNKRRSHP